MFFNQDETVKPVMDDNHINSTLASNNFYSTAISTALEDAILQLLILRSINNRNTKVFDKKIPQYKTVDERFSREENYAETRLPPVSVANDKLANDINDLLNVLNHTSGELTGSGTYNVLKSYIDTLETLNKDNEALLQKQRKNKIKIVTLKQQLSDEQREGEEIYEETWQRIQNVKYDIEKAKVYGRYESAYCIKWENSRIEQNDRACQEEEDFYLNTIKEYTEKFNVESKCHSEFLNYLEESRNDLLDEIDVWVKRYDDELEAKEGEIIEMKSSLESLTVEHQRVLALQEKREQEMADWKEYKKLREIRRKRAKVEKWASMVIQAWWRTTMVRKRLGPYKRGRKKGKANKNKK